MQTHKHLSEFSDYACWAYPCKLIKEKPCFPVVCVMNLPFIFCLKRLSQSGNICQNTQLMCFSLPFHRIKKPNSTVIIVVSTIYTRITLNLCLACCSTGTLFPLKYKKSNSVGISGWFFPHSYFCLKISKKCKSRSAMHYVRPCKINEREIWFRYLLNGHN